MFWDQKCAREKVGTEVKGEIPGMLPLSTLSQTMSPARKASKLQSPPCSSGENGSSEPGSLWNKGSVSCLQAISSATESMNADLAITSKSPLASRWNRERPSHYHNKHKSEHVKDGGLNGSTHGEMSEQTQSRDILRSNNKMKHLFSKTNIEEIRDCERPSSAETLDDFLGDTTPVPHLCIFDQMSSESEEEEEEEDELLASWQESRERTADKSSLASSGLSQSQHSLDSFRSTFSSLSDGHSLSSLLEQIRRLPPTASGQIDNLYVDVMMLLGDILEIQLQRYQEAQGGATAAHSNKDMACRPKQRLSEELPDEVDQCRVCHSGDSSPTNPLLSPCHCSGSVRFIHLDCLKKWIKSRIDFGLGPYTVRRCELCMWRLRLDPNTFDLDKYYKEQKEVDAVSFLLILREIAGGFSFRTLLAKAFLPARMTRSCPLTRVQIWSLLPYLIRMRLRRNRQRTRSAPESSDT
ncbi:E3 ubiquitin-protein ligase MARCH7-like isoform X3 [Cottoperca gobio]|uniref:RING-type E3 ubiquitin transferase n=1 Tax=Cottoperca gobio TaxID=56716 RepID=A0A6J2RS14_COTGO|nr:E3 ubiquitin-protein ligase MARCH7-like isoform X3 [Cottoperca gobio]